MDIQSSATVTKPSLKLGRHTLNMDEAWKFDTNEIFAHLDKAIDGQSPDNDNLRQMRDLIRSLSYPDGTRYADPILKPNQSIARKAAQGRKGNKSELDIDEHDPNNDDIPYWGLCDMLGLLMSLLADVSEDATTEDYYLHIAALYGRWCYRLIGSAKKNLPFMFCSVWVTDSTARAERIFLGASRGGSTRNASFRSAWNRKIKDARSDILDPELLKKLHDDIDKWPAGGKRGKPDLIKLGNCAETYPFAYLDKYHSEPWDNVHGLALRKNAILRDHYGISDILPHLRDPCPNCRWYIESRGGKPGNFEIRKESPLIKPVNSQPQEQPLL